MVKNISKILNNTILIVFFLSININPSFVKISTICYIINYTINLYNLSKNNIHKHEMYGIYYNKWRCNMNLLLIYFAFPIAVIIVSYILENLLNSPIIIFAIFLVVTFAAFDETFLIATLAYTLLALITALIARFFNNKNENDNNICEKLNNILNTISENANNNCNCNNNDDDDDNICEAVGQILNSSNNSNSCGCGCNRYRRRF